MARRFRGESVHRVDAKGRVSIPAPFRRVLEEGDPDWTEGLQPNVVMIHGLDGLKCLVCYTMKGMEELDDVVAEMDIFDPDREYLELALNNNAVQAQVDDSGRIVLNAKLRDHIGAWDEVVFSGLGEKFQIWEPVAFEAHKAEILRRRREEPGREPFRKLDETRRALRGRLEP